MMDLGPIGPFVFDYHHDHRRTVASVQLWNHPGEPAKVNGVPHPAITAAMEKFVTSIEAQGFPRDPEHPIVAQLATSLATGGHVILIITG
jgi:hypothetical protein